MWKYTELTASEFLTAVEECPIFFVPTGLLEWHGDHLPLGFDALKAEVICARVAERTGGIVLPTNYWGVAGFGSFAGTLMFGRQTMKTLFGELFHQLEKVGAKIIVLITGHYGPYQVSLVKEAARDYMNKSWVKIIAQPEYEGVDDDEGNEPADHAGRWETSFGLALFPHLVKMDAFQTGTCDIHRYDPSYSLDDLRDTEAADWAWPEDLRETASAELGEKMLSRIVDHIATQVDELKKETGIS
jgi:creatinine amidohydrolase